MNIINIRDLKVFYRTHKGKLRAIDGVKFSLNKGESIGMVGESGCGKTTLALSILKLLPPRGYIEDGNIFYKGEDLVQKSEREMRKIRGNEISIVFQGAMNSLNPVKTIGEQISEGLLLHTNMSKVEAFDKAKESLISVGISPDKLIEYPHEFSGGMKQRTMIASALVCDPQLLIADEPVTALDVMVQAQILELLNRLKQEKKLSLLLITHDLSVVAETCDKIVVVYGGKILEYANIEDSLLHPYSKELFRSFPNINGPRILSKGILGTPPNLINPSRGCRFEPRCNQSLKICVKEEPRLIEVCDQHFVACHRLKTSGA